SLRDPNYQEVKLEHFTSNEFGSFSGSFIAPNDRLTGAYSIQAQSYGGGTQVRVEEYKRPKFKVSIDTPTQSFQLDSEVSLTGRAMAYTGACIDNAQVKFRVVREVRLPPWCWWYFWDNNSSQEIAHGTLVTDKKGEFTVKFKALPDRTVARENEPTFHYTIHADVTDSTGETRSSSQIVKIGYTALSLNVSMPPVVEAAAPFNVNVSTTTLDGKGLPGAGTMLIYQLKQPNRAYRRPYNSGRLATQSDLSNIQTWEEGEVVKEESFNTSIDGYFNCDFTLPEGAYRVKAESRDRYNNKVKYIFNFTVIDYKAKSFTVKVPFFYHTTSSPTKPGDTYKGFWATGYDKGPAYIEVEHRRKLLKSFWTDPAENKVEIEVPITEDMRGGFNIRIMQVKENREYYHVQYVPINWTNKQLNLKFAHMSSKLMPGQKDTWKIEISGEEAEAGAIEMLAAMYDASLDAFAAHGWMNGFSFFYQDQNYINPTYTNYNSGLYCWRNDLNHYSGVGTRTYPQLPWNIQNDFLNYYFDDMPRSKSMRFSAGAVPPAPMASMDREEGMMLSEAAAPVMQKADLADGFTENESREEKKKEARGSDAPKEAEPEIAAGPEPDLDKVSARSNLNETAFFFPHLLTDKEGVVTMEFTVPEALTTWKFLGFAHGNNAQAGGLVGETITQKDLMVQPNPPRFLREGDKLRFTAKVTNLSDVEQKGKIRLTLQDPVTDKDRNEEFKLSENVF
ncbi:MAG: alpha-2-macroglobulin family protein, partial [Candidatus Riflebacteria bacterium]